VPTADGEGSGRCGQLLHKQCAEGRIADPDWKACQPKSMLGENCRLSN
jgi:hypothetical protein